MQYLFMLLICLFASPLVAETIGNIEYHLPQSKQSWKIANELHTDKKTQSTTVIYIPENSSRESAEEVFGAHVNNRPFSSLDQSSLEKSLQFLFPDQPIQVTILESDPTSVLYEWTIGKEKMIAYGVSRAFSTEQCPVMLVYQTKNESLFKNQRPILIQALKEAKSIAN